MHSATDKTVGFSTNMPASPYLMARHSTDVSSARHSAGSLHKIPSAITSHSAWKAFQAGMKILRCYANRSPIDTRSIAKSNLQLLHRALSQDNNLIRSVKDTQHKNIKNIKNSLPTLQRLYAEQRSSWAELVTLRAGDSVLLSGLSQPDTMYLLMSGNAQLKIKKGDDRRQAQHWWNRIGITKNKNALRSGDVITMAIDEQQNNRVLTAVGESCLLLRVRMPAANCSA